MTKRIPQDRKLDQDAPAPETTLRAEPPGPAPVRPLDSYESRVLMVEGPAGGLYVELVQNIGFTAELTIEITGSAFENEGTSTQGGVFLGLTTADALRDLGETFMALAERAEARGMLDALRQKNVRRVAGDAARANA